MNYYVKKAFLCLIHINKWGLKYLMAGFMCLFALAGFAQYKNRCDSNSYSGGWSVLHPQYREWPSPAMGIKVSHNPPILLWPATLGKGVTYDIRLSQDLAFDDYTIRIQNIPWTIYNPHCVLTPGIWYWQYRVHNGNWSPILQFRIGVNTPKVAAPSAYELLSSIPQSHPRVLMDEKNKKAFLKKCRQSPDAKKILQEAREFLNAPVPRSLKTYHGPDSIKNYEQRKLVQDDSKDMGMGALFEIKLFCEAYILTGDSIYANKGILWAKQVAGWDPQGISGVSDFGDAGCMLGMALAFDTFYDLLSEAEKKILLNQITIRANGFYNYWINNIDAKVLSNHVWQFIFHYFFQTALALHGQQREADKWLTYAYELWLARAPVLGGNDGGWANGVSYFRINMATLLDVPMTIKRLTGFDFINTTPWYANNPYWMYYSLPPGSSGDGFGDNVETITSPGPDYLAYADAISKLIGSRMAATYADKIEQTKKINLTDTNMLRWFRMRYLTDLKRPEPLPNDSLPSAMIFRDIGVVDIHSDIQNINKDLMIAMRSSPYGSYGHMLADQNTFNILYGGHRLFYLSGHKISMKNPERLKWYKATVGHNGILIDNKGQGLGPEYYGWIPRFINGKYLTYAVGDASHAYDNKKEGVQTGLKHFRRHILFLRPDIVIIYDELSADHAAHWSWLIHSPQKINLNEAENKFSCTTNNVSAVTQLWTSQPVYWKLTDTIAVPGIKWKVKKYKDGPTGYNLTAKTLRGTSKMRFLAVMQVNGENQRKMELHYNHNNDEISIGNWIIKVNMDTSKPALIQAYRKDGLASFTSCGKLINKSIPTNKHSPMGSAKLAEYVNRKWEYKNVSDSAPFVVREIPDKAKKTK